MKIHGGLDAVFRQVTPLVLLGLLLAAVFEPLLPGTSWLRATFGENIVLRGCVAALGLYVLLLWGESLRLHTLLTGVLTAFREHQAEANGGAKAGGRDPRARLEAAKLLIAAMGSNDAEIRRTSRHNLARLAGKDLGDDQAAWQRWLADQ